MWPPGHNLTLGGRELFYYGAHLRGLLTDAQVFSRALTDQEMVAYTACQEVADTPCLNSLHLISPQELRGDLASWDEAAVWTVSGNVSRTSLDTEDVCSEAGPRAGLLMVTDINYIISTTINIYRISTNIYGTRCFPRTPAGPGAATCVGGSEAACTWTPRQPRHG